MTTDSETSARKTLGIAAGGGPKADARAGFALTGARLEKAQGARPRPAP
ncbi:hypothetical protein ACFSTD_18180 [Novosphingobium colocasiae]